MGVDLQPPEVTIRDADAGDLDLLACLLGHAVAWQPDLPALEAATVLRAPGISHYLQGWPRDGDHGLVAAGDGQPIGAAWWRLFAAQEPGYGYVAADVPEVAIAMVAPWRGRGVGTLLMAALITSARSRGLGALSLSVHHDNPAARLYERLGFVAVGRLNDATTMLLEL
ncbi:MAG TPA: GNAT family N-acetyltransferase [Solirubrobacteraceae bacterium]|jgi:GNAT superfamily N-acetyltransferase